MIKIINLTPHPVTIIRRCPDPNGPPEAIIEHRTEFPACSPADLPRATEAPDNGDMGQVRDENGRIIGATGLAPASSLLAPMYRAIVEPYQSRIHEALVERNEARQQLGASAAAPAP